MKLRHLFESRASFDGRMLAYLAQFAGRSVYSGQIWHALERHPSVYASLERLERRGLVGSGWEVGPLEVGLRRARRLYFFVREVE